MRLDLLELRSRLFAAVGLAAFFVSGIGGTAQAAGAPQMAVPGQASVSATGAFAYAMPITAPPGTAGMLPSLSLVYSSQAGDGYEGMGWAVTGLSAIMRCPRTLADDSAHGSVNFDSNDRFCLNGQKLVAITGTYGADGTIYRTQSDSFAKVTSHGTAGSGPSYFTVQTKSGLTLEMGNTTDSKFKPLKADLSGVSTSVSIWAVDKITDPSTNFLTVTYTNDTTNSQLYPAEIDYTGNANASTSAYNSVQFTYMDRSADIVPQYQAGTVTKLTKLLTHIKTYAGATVITDYQLAYNYASSGASHNELSMVKQCDASANCLAPTSFTWQGSRDAPVLNTGVDVNAISHDLPLLAGDFTGSASFVADGLTDAVVLTQSCSSPTAVWAGSTSGTFATSAMTGSYNYYLTGSGSPHSFSGALCFIDGVAAAGDFNGDGFSDLQLTENHYIEDEESGDWIANTYSNVLMNSKTGNMAQQTAVLIYPEMLLGDFNGDGRTDGFGYLSNGDGSFTADSTHSGFTSGATSIIAGDFDGDGCTDLLVQGSTNAIGYFCNPAVSSATISSFSGSQLVAGDFNGDGLTDILAVGSSTATIYFATGTGLSSGVTFSYSGTPTLANWHNYTFVTSDFNGDGRTDIALISHTSGTAHAIALSTGTGFTPLTTIANSDTTAAPVVADWNSDGADDLWIQFTTSTHDTEYTFAYVPELITAVDGGLGGVTSASYDRLNKNGTLYTKGTSATYALQDLDGAYYVVKELDAPNGIGGSYATTYAYSGALALATAPPSAGPKSDLLDTGFIAFSSVTATDSQTGIVTTTNFHTDTPYIGAISSRTQVLAGVTLSSVSNTYTAVTTSGTASVVELTATSSTGHDIDGTVLPTHSVSYTYDSYANALTAVTVMGDGSTSTVTNTFNNDTTHWILGELLTKTEERVLGTSDITRHLTNTIGTSGAELGKVTEIQMEAGTTALELDNIFTHDSFGNMLTSKYQGTDISTRTTTTTYDSAGEFATGKSNPLLQGESFTFNAGFGEPTGHTDIDSRTEGWTYDSFGRMTAMTKVDGTKTGAAYAYCSGVNGGSATCPANGAFQMTVTPLQSDGTTQNGPQTVTTYDALGRAIASDVQGFDASWVRTNTLYDSNMQVSKVTRPYFLGGLSGSPCGSGSGTYCTVYVHDALGRATSVTTPDSAVTTVAYDALVTTVTDANSHATITTMNDEGLVASVEDATLHTSSYTYDGFGDLLTVTDPASNTITNTYDVRGRKTATSDPDMGSWSYAYDVLGEEKSETDAKSQTATVTYDKLGRISTRTETDLNGLWFYDGTGAIGLSKTVCNNNPCSGGTYQRTPTYDSAGRMTVWKEKIDGTNYSYTMAYDSASGRMSSVVYPSGFQADYVYTSLGYLSQIKDHASGSALWTANGRNASLQLTQATAGNGVITTNGYDPDTGRVVSICASSNSGTCDGNRANFAFDWDAVGNLSERDDTFESATEKFCYDAINRMTDSATGASCTSGTHRLMVYNSIGNLLRKSDTCNTGGCMTYGSSAGPHALTGITGTVGSFTNPTFTYDANGNMTAGLGRSFTWTSYNMAASITLGTTSFAWVYGPEHQRLKMCAGGCTSPTSTTLYLNGPAHSEKVTSGSTTTWNDYIQADNGLALVRFTTSGTTTLRYVTNDHLGSSSVLTDATGAVVERDSYDAWGRRRNANFTADSIPCSLTSQTTRGFTGQEHMDSLCLENFNARMYDPLLAHFTSADSIAQNPFDAQELNRYAYALNNPLAAIDPSGHVTQKASNTAIQCSSGADHCGCPDCFMFGTLDTMLGYVASINRGAGDGIALGAAPGYKITTKDGTPIINCYTDQCLNNALNNIVQQNGQSGQYTIIAQNYPGLSGVSVELPDGVKDPIVFINGFDAHGTVAEYINHLLQDRPDLVGHVQQFSYQDSLSDIVSYLEGLQGPIVLVANSLGSGPAGQAAVECQCVDILVTLAAVGPMNTDFQKIADSVSVWIDMKTPFGLADGAALALTKGTFGPWGYGPKDFATTFIDSPLDHGSFWPQMDVACGFDMRKC